MSVAGGNDGVELTKMEVNDGPAVVGTAMEKQNPPVDPRHLRFEIEDVPEDSSHLNNPTSPTENPNVTISSLGYNTTEAVPMTMYYRKAGEGNTRPTLDYLRQGKNNPPSEPEQNVSEEVDSAEAPPKKKWQFWKKDPNKPQKPPLKFGWIMGVLIRCVLNIWGVMLFIRLSWVVGQAGIGLAAVIILLSGVVTVITTLSMSAICTNGEVKSGGAYYLISRSLGPEFGGAIGIIFSLANAVAVALYVVGFAETVSDLLEEYGRTFTGTPINDIRVVGFILVTLLLVIALVGLNFEAKIQVVLLIILLLAILDFLAGTFIPRGTGSVHKYRGVTGYSFQTIYHNFDPDFRSETPGSSSETFFTVFAVFFPAATGILAGANISGDLKNPQTAIPKGTLLAIIITNITYLGMAVLAGTVVLRDAPGSPSTFLASLDTCNASFTDTNTNETSYFIDNNSMDSMLQCGEPPLNITALFPACSNVTDSCYPPSCLYEDSGRSNLLALCNPDFLGLIPEYNATRRCNFGALNSFQVMALVSGYGPIVTAGIFAATVSSALTSLISAPKVFQTVCNDKIFPYMIFFGKGGWRGTGNEPIRAYLLTYVIALACIAIGSLNEIAKIISNFFLMAYALINYSCFAATFAKSPGWRPAFKLYNSWVALVGSAICVVIMFIINWYFALITIVLVAILYKIVDFLKPDINWGSSTQAFLYSYSIRNLLKLQKLEDHVKNFRPQFLVLTGPPSSRPDMVHLISHVSQEAGVLICGQVLLGEFTESRHQLLAHGAQQKKWLRREKVKGFHNVVAARSLREGYQNLLQLSGLGKIKPNTLVVGFKTDWTTCSVEELEEYVALLHDAFDVNFGLIIIRLRAGFDATDHMEENKDSVSVAVNIHGPVGGGGPTNQDLASHLRQRGGVGGKIDSLSENVRQKPPPMEPAESKYIFADIPLSSSNPLNLLSSTLPKPPGDYQPITNSGDNSSIDSYTMALEGEGRVDLENDHEVVQSDNLGVPEIITMPSRFERVQEKGFIDVWWLYDDGGLAILVPFLLSRHKYWKKNCKLRIFTAGSSRNIDQAKLRMTSLLRKFRINFSAVIEVHGINTSPSPESIDKYRQLPTDTPDGLDSKELDRRTLRHIRLGELLHQYSSDAKLIVITISVPSKNVSARQYMSWLEIMSRDLPPTLLMRGNQTSVLTFYS